MKLTDIVAEGTYVRVIAHDDKGNKVSELLRPAEATKQRVEEVLQKWADEELAADSKVIDLRAAFKLPQDSER